MECLLSGYFIAQIRHQLRDNRKCENDDQVMKFTFRTLSAILEILTKVCERANHLTALHCDDMW
jgi:hypothetical protein